MRKPAKDKLRQYTIRLVPPDVDRALRKRARDSGESLNRVLLDALAGSVGYVASAAEHSDLDDLVGTWVEDPRFDEALAAQDVVDEDAWR